MGRKDLRTLGINELEAEKPLFKPNEKIIAFDVNGVLLSETLLYEGRVAYHPYKQAAWTVSRALRDKLNVVLWLACSPQSIDLMHYYPYSEAKYFIVGTSIDEDGLVKHLSKLTPNMQNVAAIEDGPANANGRTCFRPRRRVVRVCPMGDLMEAYEKAKALLVN